MRYSVYKHTCPNGKIYVGMTGNDIKKRWANGYGYKHNIYFYRAIQKYGWANIKHEILFVGLTKEEAEQKEISLIAHYKSNNPSFGYNIENGGNCTGKIAESTKQKLRDINIGKRVGEKHPMFGKHLTEEQRKKSGKVHIGKTPWNIGNMLCKDMICERWRMQAII